MRRNKRFKGTGTVAFWNDEEGWGAIEGPDLPGEVWTHFSAVAVAGYASLEAGQPVEVTYRRQVQESWRYVADEVRPRPR